MATKRESGRFVGQTENDGTAFWTSDNRVTVASRDETTDLLSALEIREEKENQFEDRIIEGAAAVELNEEVARDQSNEASSDEEIDLEEKHPLTDSIFVYPNKKLSTDHGHVLEGEIVSDVISARPCVIKISERGEKESEILRHLGSNTHVISLIQSEPFQNDLTYLAFERCHNLNLKQYLLRHKANEDHYDDGWSLNVCKQLISGLKFIHEKFVVHKDLKPSNILLTHDLRNIKIADFGSSQLLKSTSSRVYCRNMFGTLGYRPPESFGGSYISLKSDNFSLGAVFYFILSYGESPLGEDMGLWDHNTMKGIIELRHLRVRNPDTTEHLIRSLLNRDRCYRPSIWRVEPHPCWKGEEVICNFEYEFEKEDNDSDDSEDEPEEPINLEDEREAIRIIERIIPRPMENFLILFDRLTKHLMRFDPRSNAVTRMHEMNNDMKKKLYAPVALGSYIYALMDNRLLHRLNYRRNTAQWQQIADVIYDHGWFPPSVAADGKIYVVGRSSGTFTKVVSRFHPEQNRWEQITDKNLPARDAAITSTDEHVYCLGGWIDGVGASNRVERLNVKTLVWDEITSMLQARYYGTALVCNGHIFAFGGRGRITLKMNTVEKYSLQTHQWVAVKPMTSVRAGSWFRCHHLEGSIFAVSGDNDETIEKYDFDDDSWEKVETPKLDIYSSVLVRMTS